MSLLAYSTLRCVEALLLYIYLSAGFAPDDETDFAQVVFVFVFFCRA